MMVVMSGGISFAFLFQVRGMNSLFARAVTPFCVHMSQAHFVTDYGEDRTSIHKHLNAKDLQISLSNEELGVW